MNLTIRPFRPADLPVMQEITLASFPGISLDQTIEQKFGELNGHDWHWRKARHIELETNANPAGAFVAEEDGRIVAYITTTLDRTAGSGRIANLAVIAELRGRGDHLDSVVAGLRRRSSRARIGAFHAAAS